MRRPWRDVPGGAGGAGDAMTCLDCAEWSARLRAYIANVEEMSIGVGLPDYFAVLPPMVFSGQEVYPDDLVHSTGR
jgi:hypothetical protein